MVDVNCCPETGILWLDEGFADGWEVFHVANDETEDSHVVPLGDSGAHALHEDCACEPVMNSDGVWEHNSYDDREAYETKRRRPN